MVVVCSQCGEPLFDTPEVQVIQEALKALDRAPKAVQKALHAA